MMKIVASLVILGLCANIALAANGLAASVTSQSGAFSSSVLNSTVIQVLKGTNSSDAANWDSSSTTTPVAGVVSVYFGAGASNDTSYLWGIPYGAVTSGTTTGDGSCGKAGDSACATYTLGSIRKRTINNTIVGWGNDTVEASVLADSAITTTILGMGDPAITTGPGYLAILSSGTDSLTTPNQQVWVTLVSGAAGSATQKVVTATSDTIYAKTDASAPTTSQACVATTYGVGNIWYDIGTEAFFYTYWKNVATSGTTTTTGTCLANPTNAYTVWLGGIYANGTALLTAPISVGAATSANAVGSLIGGVDNTNAAQYVWLAYKDSTAETIYVSKTLISANTSAVGSFGALVKDSSTGSAGVSTLGTNVVMTYTPAVVWSSNNSYAVTVSNVTASTTYSGSTAGSYTPATTTTYGYVNYFNGTTTGTDTGLTIASTSGTLAGYQAWQLNTGYTVVSAVQAASGSPKPTTYTYATYWANGTVNTTAATAGTLSYGAPQFYEDVNGTQWIGWYDVDINNANLIYNAYLAKFQGQLNIPSGASILSAISAFFALFLAAIFVF